MATPLRFIGCLCMVTLPFGIISCSADDVPPEVFPVQGTIRHDGEFIREGGLIFLPEPTSNSTLIINAEVEANGTFQVRTEQTTLAGKVISHTGMPAGTYRVVYHPLSDGSRSGLEVELDDRVTIEARENELELVLPDKLPEGAGEPRDDD